MSQAAVKSEKRETIFRVYSLNGEHKFSAKTWDEVRRGIEEHLNALIDKEFVLAVGLRRFNFSAIHPLSPSLYRFHLSSIYPFGFETKECRDLVECVIGTHCLNVKVFLPVVILKTLNAQTFCEFTVQYGIDTVSEPKASR